MTLLPGGVVVDLNDTDALDRRIHDITADASRTTIEEEAEISLDAGLPVRLLDASANGWAFVECSNGWQCYVAAWGIVAIEGA